MVIGAVVRAVHRTEEYDRRASVDNLESQGGLAIASRWGDRRAKLAFLDGFRGLAALYVLVFHARWLLWEGRAAYEAHRQGYSAAGRILVELLTAFRWGHEAVIFFFVLSGFVIHLRYAIRLTDGSRGFDFWPYLARRARRLYPPLAAALLLTLALDGVGRALALPTASGTTLYPVINAGIGSDHSPLTALRNLAFIMDPVFGSDRPLWSLGYEWYFYLIYPAVFLIARRSRVGATLSLVGLSILGNAHVWPTSLAWLGNVFKLMIVWWLGALLAERFAGRLQVGYRKLRWFVLVPAVLVARPWGPFAHDLFVGLGFFGLIAACLARLERGRLLAVFASLRPLGDMSYTLYVLHFPILVLMSGWLMKARGGPLPGSVAWAGFGIAVSLMVAWALHLVVEKPFMARRGARAPGGSLAAGRG